MTKFACRLLAFVFVGLIFISLGAYASIPLEDEQLSKGRARTLKQPDYLFKLLDKIYLNSGYKINKSRDNEADVASSELEKHGTLNLTSQELYDLDREFRKLMDPVLDKLFPGEFNNYNLIFSDNPNYAAAVVPGESASAVPTIILGRMLLNELPYADDIVGVIVHEISHVRRARFGADPIYDRALKMMAEEDLGDFVAVRAEIESGFNPLGYARAMELLLKISRQDSARGFNRTGFMSHPPTEVRLTHINSLIEKFADKKNYPKLKPLPPKLQAIAKLPRAQLGARVRYKTATAESFAGAIEHLASFAGGYVEKARPAEDVLENLKLAQAELEVIIARVAPERLNDWQIKADWRRAARAIHNLWKAIPPWDRHSPKIIEAVEKLDNRLAGFAHSLGFAYESFSANRQRGWALLARVRSWEDLKNQAAWVTLPDNNKDKYNARGDELEWLTESLPYESYRDEKVFSQVISQYIQLTPILYEKILSLTGQGARAYDPGSPGYRDLRIIIDYRDTILGMLSAWGRYSFYSEKNPKSDQVGHNSVPLRASELAVAGNHSKYMLATYGVWYGQMGKLNLPARAKLLLLPPLKEGFSRTSEDPVYEGQGAFAGSEAYLVDPRVDGQDMAHILKTVELLRATSLDRKGIEIPFTSLSTDYYGPERLPVGTYNSRTWFFKQLEVMRVTLDDVNLVLELDNYWKLSSSTSERLSRNNVSQYLHDWADATVFFTRKFFTKVSKRDEKRLHNDIDDTVDRIYGENFYSRKEYMVSDQGMQAALYAALHRQRLVPVALTQEAELWLKFAKRGVTAFTDSWAGSLVDRLIEAKIQPDNITALSALYYSNLVWDLKLRQRMALEVLQPAHSPLLQAILATPREQNLLTSLFTRAPKRSDLLMQLLVQIKHEFPEPSEERLHVVDRLAERIRADESETSLMMTAIGHNERDLKDVEITRKHGFGIRFYAQLFGELQNCSLRARTQLLSFLLGKTDQVPRILIESELYIRGSNDRAKDEKINEPLLYWVRTEVNPMRLRQAFQTLSQLARTGTIDPFFIGTNGLIEQSEGRKWIIDTLVPEGVSWREMAVDLVDGWREGLAKLGQAHLKTLFISYLVAASFKRTAGQFPQYFPLGSHVGSGETDLGRMLYSLFSANAAMQKIGQRVHSANIFDPEVNISLASVKESAAHILREDQFDWIKDAAPCDQACQAIKLVEEIGNASIKAVLVAEIKGQESVLYLIKPNAFNRGDVFFEVMEYAVQYAINKGHKRLRLFQPMIKRGRATFAKEIDLQHERQAAQKFSQIYRPGETFGKGFQFTTPEFLDTTNLLKPELAAAVRRVKVKRFSELNATEQTEFAAAVTACENKLHQQNGDPTKKFIFDKDRHEGNYLLVTDEEVLRKLGVQTGKLILVIDFSQISEITPQMANAVKQSIAVTAGLQNRLLNEDGALTRLQSLLNEHLKAQGSAAVDKEQLREGLHEAMKLSDKAKPGEALSRFLAYVEGEAVPLADDVWDYLTALATNQTWDRYEPNNAFSQGLRSDVTNRCMQLLFAR